MISSRGVKKIAEMGMASKERLFVLGAIIISAGNILGAFEISTAVIVTIAILIIAHFRKRMVVLYKTLPRDIV